MIGGSLQSIDRVCLYVNREEVDLELLFKVPLGLDRENASVCFLMKHIFGPLSGMTIFEECEDPEDFLLFIVELLWGQVDVERAGVQKCTAIVMFSTKVWRTGELGTHPSHRRNRRWRHQRRWYEWGRCVWYGQRGRISH